MSVPTTRRRVTGQRVKASAIGVAFVAIAALYATYHTALSKRPDIDDWREHLMWAALVALGSIVGKGVWHVVRPFLRSVTDAIGVGLSNWQTNAKARRDARRTAATGSHGATAPTASGSGVTLLTTSGSVVIRSSEGDSSGAEDVDAEPAGGAEGADGADGDLQGTSAS